MPSSQPPASDCGAGVREPRPPRPRTGRGGQGPEGRPLGRRPTGSAGPGPSPHYLRMLCASMLRFWLLEHTTATRSGDDGIAAAPSTLSSFETPSPPRRFRTTKMAAAAPGSHDANAAAPATSASGRAGPACVPVRAPSARPRAEGGLLAPRAPAAGAPLLRACAAEAGAGV